MTFLQIIMFGREHCPARWHDLSTCPICGWAATASASPRKRDDGDQRLNRLVARAMIVPVTKGVIPAIQMS